MKLIMILLFFLSLNTAVQQNSITEVFESDELLKMTVVFESEHPIYEWKMDTLIKDSIISKKTAIIDLYFAQKLKQISYYLPTNGMFREAQKDNECEMSIYPRNVKCYEYDRKGRVTKMSVEGSGTTGYTTYKYDSYDRVKKMERFSTTYTAKYLDKTQLLTELKVESPSGLNQLILTYR